MIHKSNVCDPAKLAAFLADEMQADDERRLEQHLEVCAACRTRLHESAADDASWNDAGRYLRDEPFDDQPLSTHEGHLADGVPFAQGESMQHVVELLDPTDDPRMLGRLAGYEIVGVIGAGGMGVVLKGFDAALNRYVAIKVLAPHLASSGAARARFSREAQAAAAVVHQHVVAIHSVSADGRLPFLVMPYLRGMSLQKRIDQHGPLATTEILRIAAQAAVGLAAAHAQGLVHRDIKPANILLEDGVERVAITDFGLARAVDDATTTRSGVIAGTPQYMSPEQARGEAIDHRSDLFSLGSVMYAMCTGRSPFRAESTFGILRRITDSEPRPVREVNSEIPEWLAAVIARLHAKDPGDRFQSASELAELLEQCLAHLQQPTLIALPAELRAIGRRRLAKPAVLAGASAALSIAALAAAIALSGMFAPEAPPIDRAEVNSSELASQRETTIPPVGRADWGDDDATSLLEFEHDLLHLEAETESALGPEPPADSFGYDDP